ncbi:MAG: DUF5985 family protein [Myxococcota bacterium]
MMAQIVYASCALTSIVCAALLVRSYWATRLRLLLWSSLCFAGLALNNTLLFVDRILVPEFDLQLPRTLVALVAMSMLLFGLIWESL